MKEFNFGLPQNIIYGQGCVARLAELLPAMGGKKALIVSDPMLNQLGFVKKIVDICDAAGLEHEVFAECEPNPSVETVDRATALYKEASCDCMVAIGGGSSVDVAKAVGVLAKFGGKITEYEGGGKVPGDIVPFIAIPTTAGTGSEVTAFSVITDHSRNYKLTVFSYKLLPAHAILDPDFITSLPASVAASTGIDAMVHAIEAYISKAANPFTEAMSEKALELLAGNIRAFVSDRSNVDAAGTMLMGSCLAGVAFNLARLGNVHAMAHPLGGFFNVPHGVANAILLPVCMEFNALADDGKYRKLYDLISPIKSGVSFRPQDLVEEIKRLTTDVGIPSCLADVGVTEDKIPDMAADAMKSGNILVNPRSTTLKDIEMLYHKAMY